MFLASELSAGPREILDGGLFRVVGITGREMDHRPRGADEAMRGRDEFNFSVGIAFSQTPLPAIRQHLADLSRQQYARNQSPAAPR